MSPLRFHRFPSADHILSAFASYFGHKRTLLAVLGKFGVSATHHAGSIQAQDQANDDKVYRKDADEPAGGGAGGALEGLPSVEIEI